MELDRVAIRLAYLGGSFAGWQRQPGARTVQGVLEEALARLYRQPVKVVGAGRTDAGVHADGQVAHFDPPLAIPVARLAAALNSFLPADVQVLGARPVPPTFDARRSALAKRYRYRLAWGGVLPPWESLRRWRLAGTLDVRAVERASRALRGEHDFAAFALAGHSGRGARGTVRRLISATARAHGRRLDLVFVGDGFLRGMVRRLVGAVVEVGRGAQEPAWLAALLSDPGTRPPAPTAPAAGLTLERVFYERHEA